MDPSTAPPSSMTFNDLGRAEPVVRALHEHRRHTPPRRSRCRPFPPSCRRRPAGQRAARRRPDGRLRAARTWPERSVRGSCRNRSATGPAVATNVDGRDGARTRGPFLVDERTRRRDGPCPCFTCPCTCIASRFAATAASSPPHALVARFPRGSRRPACLDRTRRNPITRASARLGNRARAGRRALARCDVSGPTPGGIPDERNPHRRSRSESTGRPADAGSRGAGATAAFRPCRPRRGWPS